MNNFSSPILKFGHVLKIMSACQVSHIIYKYISQSGHQSSISSILNLSTKLQVCKLQLYFHLDFSSALQLIQNQLKTESHHYFLLPKPILSLKLPMIPSSPQSIRFDILESNWTASLSYPICCKIV